MNILLDNNSIPILCQDIISIIIQKVKYILFIIAFHVFRRSTMKIPTF